MLKRKTTLKMSRNPLKSSSNQLHETQSCRKLIKRFKAWPNSTKSDTFSHQKTTVEWLMIKCSHLPTRLIDCRFSLSRNWIRCESRGNLILMIFQRWISWRRFRMRLKCRRIRTRRVSEWWVWRSRSRDNRVNNIQMKMSQMKSQWVWKMLSWLWMNFTR